MDEQTTSFDKKIEKQTDKEIIAHNIAFFRKKLGLSQTALAKQLQYSNKNISKWELGETTPDIFTLKKLAVIFGVTVDTLIHPITNDNEVAVKTQSIIPMKWKVYMIALINSIILLMTCIAFFILKSLNITDFNPYMVFMWALPIMDLTIFIFICIVKKRVDIFTLSLFGWLITICLHLTFMDYSKIVYIYIITIGFQILVPFFANLVNSGKIIKLNKIFFKKIKNKEN